MVVQVGSSKLNWLDFRKKMFSEDVSIDLGTANTLMYVKDKGVVLEEPSVVTVRKNSKNGEEVVCAVGNDAKAMLGRTPMTMAAIRPLKDGVIADFHVTEKMLQHFIGKITKNSIFKISPRVLVSVPCGSTQVERRAIRESIIGAGAREVYLIEEAMSAAVGAGLPVDDAKGSMVVDIGGGTTEVAIISLSGIVYSESVRVGGDRFDDSILNYVRRNFGSLIGEATAEKIKKSIGSAYPVKEMLSIEISGRNVAEGVPRSFSINSNEVLEALQEPLAAIVSSVRHALEEAPPELAADIYNTGIYLAGGGSMLRGLDKRLSQKTDLPVYIAEDPLRAVVRGTGITLKNIGRFKGVLIK